MRRIITVSRRTDIPAFYTPWLINRLQAGYCHTINPYGGQVYRVALLPEDVISIGFYTRNPAPLLPYLDGLQERGYGLYFDQTILGSPPGFESHNPPIEAAVKTFQQMSARLGAWRSQWRYDPIIFSSLTPAEYHLARFAEIARMLEGYTQHCTFSVMDFYGKTRRNLVALTRTNGIQFYNPPIEEQRDLIGKLVEIAGQYGIQMFACCEGELQVAGVLQNHCVDPGIIGRLSPQDPLPTTRPSRSDCGCIASTDIGVYDTCLFGCSYCYATNSRQAAQQRHAQHDPSDSILWRPEHLRGVDLDALSTPLKIPQQGRLL
jgi:hypothetical protein